MTANRVNGTPPATPGQEVVRQSKLVGTGWLVVDSTGRLYGDTLADSPDSARQKFTRLHSRDLLLSSARVGHDTVACVVLEAESTQPQGPAPHGALVELADALSGLGETLLQIGTNAKEAGAAARQAAEAEATKATEGSAEA